MVKNWAAVGCVAAMLAAGGAGAAPVGVDGVLDGGEYGAGPTATVMYDAAAPSSNFDSPTAQSNAIGYSIYLKTTPGFVQGLLQANPSGGGSAVGAFANLYFDLDPQNNNGSDIGFELSAGSQTAFVAGVPGTQPQSNIVVAVNGLTLEFAIPVADFTGPIPGLEANYEAGQVFAANGSDVVLRLSQSFGYSVAGGASFGDNRLGRVTLQASAPADVPEPATLALLGMGLLGLGAARRRA